MDKQTLMELIYNTPNDQELGSKLREWYWSQVKQDSNKSLSKQIKYLIVTLLLTLNVNAQNTLSKEELQTKIELDTKVETSKNYLMVSAIVTTVGFVSTTNDNINVLGLGAAIAGAFTTPYHFVRHRVYVSKRNKFYKQHNLNKNQ